MAILLETPNAGAQITAAVPLDARAGSMLERLRGLGLIDRLPSGQAPLTRRQVARLAGEAAGKLDHLAAAPERQRTAEALIQWLQARYDVPEQGAAPAADTVIRHSWHMDGFMLSSTWLDSPARGVTSPGMTSMTAQLNPLVEPSGGRRHVHGLTSSADLILSAEAGHFAVSGRGRATALTEHRGTTSSALEVPELHATAGIGNARLTVGRAPLRLGQGMNGGLMVSGNAGPLPMLQLRTERPGHLPGFLRGIGPAHGTLFLADLGAGQNFPHARLAGWKVSLFPSSQLEAGVFALVQTGGEGAPGATLGERVIDLLPLIDVLIFQDRDLLFSNKLAGLDARWRHMDSGTELYVEAAVDDFDVRRVRSSLWEDGGLVAGVSVPAAGRAGRLRLDAEYQHTGLRFYEHGQFTSGVTYRNAVIGLPLGPRGNAIATQAGLLAKDGGEVTAALSIEQRSADQYVTSVDGPDDSGWRFVKTEDRPEEIRTRFVMGWLRAIGGTGQAHAEAGIEHARNHRFVDDARRTNLLVRLGMSWGF